MKLDKNTNVTISRIEKELLSGMKPPHYHLYHEMLYLQSGECKMFINHNIYKLVPGNLVIIPAGEIHKANYSNGGKHQWISISFTTEDLSWVSESIGKSEIEEAIKRIVFSLPEKWCEYVERILTRLIQENEYPDELSESLKKVLFQELVLFIMRFQMREENAIKEIDAENTLVQQIATYVYNNYDKDVYLDEVAIKYNISRSYLSKRFKAITGFGFKEYLVNIRVKHACKYLLETDQSITDIAFLCGFNDSNYFGDAFRNVMGISPNKYRKFRQKV